MINVHLFLKKNQGEVEIHEFNEFKEAHEFLNSLLSNNKNIIWLCKNSIGEVVVSKKLIVIKFMLKMYIKTTSIHMYEYHNYQSAYSTALAIQENVEIL